MLAYKFNCDQCIIHTNSRQTYNRHLLSKRHVHMQYAEVQYKYSCEKCKKKFKGNSGLWGHSKTCKVEPAIPIPDISKTIQDTIQVAIHGAMKEYTANQQPTNITNNNHNNFNVNLFLNENVTQAKNFIDMIQNISVKGPYPEKISSENYVSCVFQMIKNEIDKMPIDERPIHCIKNEDENQNILHIRHDDKWEKETELEWTSQIHNYYLDDGDEPSPEEEKIIFNGLKQLEENIKNEIANLNNMRTDKEYSYEICHPPNKVRIIKCLLDYVNIDKSQLLQIIEKAYKNRHAQLDKI